MSRTQAKKKIITAAVALAMVLTVVAIFSSAPAVSAAEEGGPYSDVAALNAALLVGDVDWNTDQSDFDAAGTIDLNGNTLTISANIEYSAMNTVIQNGVLDISGTFDMRYGDTPLTMNNVLCTIKTGGVQYFPTLILNSGSGLYLESGVKFQGYDVLLNSGSVLDVRNATANSELFSALFLNGGNIFVNSAPSATVMTDMEFNAYLKSTSGLVTLGMNRLGNIYGSSVNLLSGGGTYLGTVAYDSGDWVYSVSSDGAVPTIITSPSDSAITAGQSTTFTVAAAGDPTLIYTWQVWERINYGYAWYAVDNNAVISGVNTATLTLSNVPVSYNGEKYRCVVTNGEGSRASDTVTLTVAAPSVRYPVAVTNGSSEVSSAGAGETVTIWAGGYSSGIRFVNWVSSDGVTFADENEMNTTFIMPANAVRVTAVWELITSDTPDTCELYDETGGLVGEYSFNDALEAASDNYTIKLLDWITLTGDVVTDKAITININDKMLSIDGNADFQKGLTLRNTAGTGYGIDLAGSLTVSGGAFDLSPYMRTFNLNGGTLDITGAASASIHWLALKDGVIYVNDAPGAAELAGEFTDTEARAYLSRVLSASAVSIDSLAVYSGHTGNMLLMDAGTGEPIGILRYVYSWPPEEYTWTYTPAPTDPVCEIVGGSQYIMLELALSAVQDGQTVRLLEDIDYGKRLNITNGKTFTLDLNGKTLSLTDPISGDTDGLLIGGSNVTFVATGGGDIVCGWINVEKNGSLILPFGVVSSEMYYQIWSGDNSSVTINGDVELSGDEANICVDSGGSITINGDVVMNGLISSRTAVEVRDEGTITINGNVTTTGRGARVSEFGGII
ncbi:MAG: hypothetical protein FWF40_01515, partial [Methanomassiliicoccaceae archaeon]|nr:hypothetical protein [Methanomassiliicoccaceae archaeon]